MYTIKKKTKKLIIFFLTQGYCSEQADFQSNCENLSPESELVTIYRESTLGEKCPLGGLYVQVPSHQPTNNNNNNNNNNDEQNAKCKDSKKSSGKSKDSMIMQCSDPSMLKLQFGKCSTLPSRHFLQPTFVSLNS